MKRVALCLFVGRSHSLRILQGVREACLTAGEEWIFHPFPPDADGVERLRQWRPDGALIAVHDRSVGAQLEALGLPMVNVGGREEAPALSHVGPDLGAAGGLAADHLHQQGLRHMAFVGWPGHEASAQLADGFRHRLAALGMSLIQHLPDRQRVQQGHPPEGAALAAWLRQLPLPVGVLATHDYLAWMVAEAIRQAGLRIPEDIALMGTEDDASICELIHRPLTSVQFNPRRIGLEAAAMLTRQMAGRPGPEMVQIAPLGVAVRASTDLQRIADPVVQQAMTLIAGPGGLTLTVIQLAHRLGIPQRTLERRFSLAVGRSILAEIQRRRLQRAHTLLATTELTVEAIAQECGFTGSKNFAGFFRSRVGMTPSAYRQGSMG